MVKLDDVTKAERWKRGRPRYPSREKAEIGKQQLEKQTNKEYVVVKNPFGDDFYLRKKRKQ